LIYFFIIETSSDNPLIDYRLNSTHFGETCQQGFQEERGKGMWITPITVHLNIAREVEDYCLKKG